jgi:c-di-GMP-binding flagellar brake protein YcgR
MDVSSVRVDPGCLNVLGTSYRNNLYDVSMGGSIMLIEGVGNCGEWGCCSLQ